MVTGENWKQTLSDFAGISNVLAGFSITLIILLYKNNSNSVNLDTNTVAILLFGLTTIFFIFASQVFLRAKEYHILNINKIEIEKIKKDYNDEEWYVFLETQSW